MIPDLERRQRLVMKSVALLPDLWEQLDAIVDSENVKSRNALMGAYLRFCCELLPRLKKQEKRLHELAEAEKWSVPEMFYELIQLGMAAYEKERRGKR
jgi:hypothetical protein